MKTFKTLMAIISELKLLTFTPCSSQQFGQECEVAACRGPGPDALDLCPLHMLQSSAASQTRNKDG